MSGYLEGVSPDTGIIKLAIETGAVHGGIVMPDGSIARVRLDFNVISKLSKLVREKYKLAGVVQHGASTLPPEAFEKFPQNDTLEVHLATQFQNIVYDTLPLSLKEEIYNWLFEELHHEKKESQTNAQFIYKTRKKALGKFKNKLNALPKDIKNNIRRKLKDEFSFLFHQLNLEGSADMVNAFIRPKPLKKEIKLQGGEA